MPTSKCFSSSFVNSSFKECKCCLFKWWMPHPRGLYTGLRAFSNLVKFGSVQLLCSALLFIHMTPGKGAAVCDSCHSGKARTLETRILELRDEAGCLMPQRSSTECIAKQPYNIHLSEHHLQSVSKCQALF
ncbi:hypothetical protein ACRRTK_015227 [Alexandromys fortis]